MSIKDSVPYLLPYIWKVSTTLDIIEMQNHLPLLRLLSYPLLSVSLCNHSYLPLSMELSTTLHILSIGRTSTTYLDKYTDHYLCTALTTRIILDMIYGWNHHSKIELTDIRMDAWLKLTFRTDSLSVTFGACWCFGYSYPLTYLLFYNWLFMWESYSMSESIIYTWHRTTVVFTVFIITVIGIRYVPIMIVC